MSAKTKPKSDSDEMRQEYDFSAGVRGKHAKEFHQGYSVVIHKADGSTVVQDFGLPEGAVMLDLDVRAYFRDSEAVNRALRGLIELIPEPDQSPRP